MATTQCDQAVSPNKVDTLEKHPIQNETNISETSDVPQLSKKQQKKLMRRQQWQEQKAERRIQQKVKRKEKRREKIERGEDIGPSKKKLKMNTMKKSSCGIHVVIDCSFDDLMADKDINKLGQQIQYCYSSNRRAKEPLQLYLTSIGNKTKDRLDRIGDYRGWDIHVDRESYFEKFDKTSIVYLTSDSQNVLETLTPEKVYIIGGLVDHNHHKGLCFNQALEKGISHAQLPIADYIQLSSRRVLTVNHVFEILLRYTETKSWKEAFFKVIPKRKQACGSCDNSENNGSTDNIDGNIIVDNAEASYDVDGSTISEYNCSAVENNDTDSSSNVTNVPNNGQFAYVMNDEALTCVNKTCT